MEKIYLTQSQTNQMEAHVREIPQEESCGILAGIGEVVYEIFPITNQMHSSVRFLMDSAEMILAMLQIEKEGMEIIGIYHSHPAGPDNPSHTDISEYQYPGTAVIIWSPDEQFKWKMKAFIIQNGISLPISYDIIGKSN